jgi:hypothetical protein
MLAAVHHSPEDIEAALSTLDLTVEPLLRAVQAGYLARISRTANDAPIAGGFYQWNETLRTLREGLAPAGWARSDESGFSTAEHPERKMRIAVSSGDLGTGRIDAIPKTRRSKGPRTAAAVSVNAAQLDLFPNTLARPKSDDSKVLTWVLLFCCDADQLRAELSLPVYLDDGGHIDAWRERILLPSQSIDPSFVMPEPDFGPDIDVEIARRA